MAIPEKPYLPGRQRAGVSLQFAGPCPITPAHLWSTFRSLESPLFVGDKYQCLWFRRFCPWLWGQLFPQHNRILYSELVGVLFCFRCLRSTNIICCLEDRVEEQWYYIIKSLLLLGIPLHWELAGDLHVDFCSGPQLHDTRVAYLNLSEAVGRGSVICLAYFTGLSHGQHTAECLL